MQPDEPQVSVVLRYFLTVVIFVLIVFGNSLTIHVVRKNRNLTSIKHYYYGYYIMNLSISDLLVGLVCIPTTFLYYIFPGKWRFGLFTCKLFPTMQIMVVSASISTLTVITFERFLAIVHPLKPRSTLTSVRLKIIAIWIWSFIIALPSFIAYKITKEGICEEKGIHHWYTIALFLANYAVPLSFIFLTYMRIIWELQSQSCTGSKREMTNHKKFLKLTIILVIGFALCFLPSNVMFFVLGYSKIQYDMLTVSICIQYFHILIWFNSCLNPFIYGSVDTHFKRGFKKAFGLTSSNDSQEKTNVSRMSFRGEKPTQANNNWLSAEVPEEKNSSPSLKTVRFQGPIPDAANNPDPNNRTRNTVEDRTSDSQNRKPPNYAVMSNSSDYNGFVNPSQVRNSGGKGYVSLILYQSKSESNMDLTESDGDENKELFVDLDSRKKLNLYRHIGQDLIIDFSDKVELKRIIQSSRETNI